MPPIIPPGAFPRPRLRRNDCSSDTLPWEPGAGRSYENAAGPPRSADSGLIPAISPEQQPALQGRADHHRPRTPPSPDLVAKSAASWLGFRKRSAHIYPSFPVHDSPRASIVIPVFNHFVETYYCLESIFENTSDIDYELIVVDDGSSDQTADLLHRIDGLSSLAIAATWASLVHATEVPRSPGAITWSFLNNDTTVTPGWLEALIATFKDFPSAGMAGAKLVYPDGRLQEAGGAIWRDASGWNYGKFDDPDHPRYNFAREADYCSAPA